MGHPGTLPTINKEAVKNVLKMGVAVGGELADFTEFDRKNYFYPDIPKGYQISQYKYPLVKGGRLAGVKLTRIHLEEDTAKSTHDTGDFSVIDFNRAGMPLMELVTEPVIKSAEEAVKFAKELQLLLQYLGIGNANMEKGEMRVEANISVSPNENFGTKVEVKNLNSFKAVERAILYEVDRHSRLLEKGEKVVQETRGFDEQKQITYSQRLKEDSHDYRYFPDPDLPKLKISEIVEFSTENLKKEMPELPWEKRERYAKEYEIKNADIDIFAQDIYFAKYFEDIAGHLKGDKKLIQLASSYLTTDYMALLKGSGKVGSVGSEAPNLSVGSETPERQELIEAPASSVPTPAPVLVRPEAFAELTTMIGEGKLTSRAAKDILAILFNASFNSSSPLSPLSSVSPLSPLRIAEDRGLIQKNDEGELEKLMTEIIANNSKTVTDYRAGKVAAMQSLIGQGMKATKGSANPEILKKIALRLLIN
jgi:aspartyl-tRNA(Asn)/glutamyl-tRNA(Gln) amidotransferase subunit B